MFKNYDEIRAVLKKAGLRQAAGALDAALNAEAATLYAESPHHYSLGDLGKKALEDAKALYAHDVVGFLEHDNLSLQIEPEAVIASRRYAVAWAVASIIKREGLHLPPAAPEAPLKHVVTIDVKARG